MRPNLVCNTQYSKTQNSRNRVGKESLISTAFQWNSEVISKKEVFIISWRTFWIFFQVLSYYFSHYFYQMRKNHKILDLEKLLEIICSTSSADSKATKEQCHLCCSCKTAAQIYVQKNLRWGWQWAVLLFGLGKVMNIHATLQKSCQQSACLLHSPFPSPLADHNI